ncbi:unnamed protein product, partial [Polarella glacialis]
PLASSLLRAFVGLTMERCGSNELADVAGPEDAANVVSRYSFWWAYPSIKVANQKGRLSEKELPQLPLLDGPASLFQRSAALWRRGLAARGAKLELVQSIYWGVQKRQLLTSFLHGWTFLFLMTIDPLILRV